MIDDSTKQTIRFIIDLIDYDEIDQYIFNNCTDFGLGIVQTPYGTITLELIKDIRYNQEHYRKFI